MNLLELFILLDVLPDGLQALQAHGGQKLDSDRGSRIVEGLLVEGRRSDNFLQLGQNGDSLKIQLVNITFVFSLKSLDNLPWCGELAGVGVPRGASSPPHETRQDHRATGWGA